MATSYTTEIILPMGGSNTGIEVPPDVLSSLGESKRPKVRVTLNGSYSPMWRHFGLRSTIPVTVVREVRIQ